MTLSLKCTHPDAAPVIEGVQLNLRFYINGQLFELSNMTVEPATGGTTGPIVHAGPDGAADAHTDAKASRTPMPTPTDAHTLTDAKNLTNANANVHTPPHTAHPHIDTAATETAVFWQAFEAFIAEQGRLNSWTPSTYYKFEVVRHLLANFRTETERQGAGATATATATAAATAAVTSTATAGSSTPPSISFSHFDTAGLNDYIHFLSTTKNMCNSTIINQLGFLKWFLRWSLDKGFHRCRDFEWFKPKLRTTTNKVIFLTDKELNRIRDFKIPHRKQYLERVRDVFLFCCFTGLRYSDVFNLKRSDVKNKTIEITTIKTADSLVIELNDHSRMILDKYKQSVYKDNKALPVISNQRMNVYLKELGKLAAIDEPVRRTYFKGNRRIDEVVPKHQLLATHVGRRTFVCNALALGISPEVVMKWTGHSNYAAMKPYIDIADHTKASAMRRFNRLAV